MRDGAALERVADLVRAAGPRLPDDVDGVRGDLLRVRPLEQEAGHRLVEDLVRPARRPQHVVVDPPVRHRFVDRLAGGPVAPAAPLDQETALGVRMELVHPAEQLGAGHARQPLARRARARPATRRPQPLERPKRRGARRLADNRVVARVALPQLRLDRARRLAGSSSTASSTGTSHAGPTLVGYS